MYVCMYLVVVRFEKRLQEFNNGEQANSSLFYRKGTFSTLFVVVECSERTLIVYLGYPSNYKRRNSSFPKKKVLIIMILTAHEF